MNVLSRRAGRRSKGKRELRRVVDAKTRALVAGYQQGYSVKAMALRLGFTLEEVERLYTMMRENEEERSCELQRADKSETSLAS